MSIVDVLPRVPLEIFGAITYALRRWPCVEMPAAESNGEQLARALTVTFDRPVTHELDREPHDAAVLIGAVQANGAMVAMPVAAGESRIVSCPSIQPIFSGGIRRDSTGTAFRNTVAGGGITPF